MLDNLSLIHMNGRVMDPLLGRFISADPNIDGVMDTQGWNRYSYVKNGPLSATDPSGFNAERRRARRDALAGADTLEIALTPSGRSFSNFASVEGVEGVSVSQIIAAQMLAAAGARRVQQIVGQLAAYAGVSEANRNVVNTALANLASSGTPGHAAIASEVSQLVAGRIGSGAAAAPSTQAALVGGPNNPSSGSGGVNYLEEYWDYRGPSWVEITGVDEVTVNALRPIRYRNYIGRVANFGLTALGAQLFICTIDGGCTRRQIGEAASTYAANILGGVAIRGIVSTVRAARAAVAARGGGFFSRLGGTFSDEANSAGGTVWTSVGDINQNDVARIVDGALYRGETSINIITGVHGYAGGTTKVASELFRQDLQRFGSIPGVSVFDFTALTPAARGSLLNGPGTTIGAFCNSGACLAPFR
jgi:RHS repeat-associated protein